MDTKEANSPTAVLRPTQYLEQKAKENGDPASKRHTALIILNSPISGYSGYDCIQSLHDHASFVVCADGGANRLHDLLIDLFEQDLGTGIRDWKEALRGTLPDVIHGDLDSLQDTVRKRFEQIGVEVTQDPDQYSTDFGKAVKVVLERLPNVKDVLVHGSLGGRVDQGIGLLHELYREQMLRHPELQFWLFSEASVSFVLRAGTSRIHTPLAGGLIKRNIGILPVYGPAVITTKGLEWDVEDWPTEMGRQLSTSNHITADWITISTNTEVLFTVQRAVEG